MHCENKTNYYYYKFSPLVLEVDVLPVCVCESAAEGVEDGGAGADVPLLDHAGVDVDVLVAGDQLPDLISRHITHNTLTLTRSNIWAAVVQQKLCLIIRVWQC